MSMSKTAEHTDCETKIKNRKGKPQDSRAGEDRTQRDSPHFGIFALSITRLQIILSISP